ncbi:MAG: PfkB family carbohydrate kinase [Phycisphaerales bacterium JB043]
MGAHDTQNPFTRVATSLEDVGVALSSSRVLAGFDAFVDRICDVVDHRSAPGTEHYTRCHSLQTLASRIADASGLSASFELVTRTTKPGGNALLCASALASLGAQTEFVGAVADPSAPDMIHPDLKPLEALFARVAPLAPPGITDALEFDDGKLMLGRPQSLDTLTRDGVLGDDSRGGYIDSLRDADALLFGNWAMHHALTDIWVELASRLASLETRPRLCLVDLADTTRRTDQDLRVCVEALRTLQRRVPLTLSLNAREATHLARVVGCEIGPQLNPDTPLDMLVDAAHALRDALALERIIIHTHSGASSSTGDSSAHVHTAHVQKPLLSTGAGDHFNAGCLAGYLLNVDDSLALACGCALSGFYITRGRAPTMPELTEHSLALPGA